MSHGGKCQGQAQQAGLTDAILSRTWLLPFGCWGSRASTHLASPTLATNTVPPTSHTATHVAPSTQFREVHSCSTTLSVAANPWDKKGRAVQQKVRQVKQRYTSVTPAFAVLLYFSVTSARAGA